ncbi:MAG: CNNM domain-containing protein [Pseudomonadota bacterium]
MYSLLITYFSIAIVTSFLCSLWESVLLSVTPAYAEIKIQKGEAIGRRLKVYKDDIDRPLAAILTLNTIAHTIGAIGVGVEASKIWAAANPLITGLAVPVVMTLGILILSEIIPKTLGANYWQELTGFTVSSLELVIVMLLPLVAACQVITSYLKRDKSKSIFSRADFVAMAEIGAQKGVFDEDESQLIVNLLRFNGVTAENIMTPRTVVTAAAQDLTAGQFHDMDARRFSRIPLYEGDEKDSVTGYVLKDEVLEALASEQAELPLTHFRREIMIIDQTFPIPDLFDRFLDKREHIALVVDEFGGMAGIVTMEDVIETMLGTEIVDERDANEDMQALARRLWEARAKRAGLVEESSASEQVSNERDETSS